MFLLVTALALTLMAPATVTYGYPLLSENKFLIRYPGVYIFHESGGKLKRTSPSDRCALCYPDSAAGNFSEANYETEWGTNNCAGCYPDSKPFDYKKTANNNGGQLQCKGNESLCNELLELIKSKVNGAIDSLQYKSIVFKSMPEY